MDCEVIPIINVKNLQSSTYNLKKNHNSTLKSSFQVHNQINRTILATFNYTEAQNHLKTTTFSCNNNDNYIKPSLAYQNQRNSKSSALIRYFKIQILVCVTQIHQNVIVYLNNLKIYSDHHKYELNVS